MRIFEITTPLSKYLQTSGMDIQKAYIMVENTVKELKLLKRDDADLKNVLMITLIQLISNWIKKTKKKTVITVISISSLKVKLPTLRTRINKRRFDERGEDEPIIDPC